MSPDPQKRRKAAREAERSQDLRIATILAPLARQDPDAGVRFVALKALRVFHARLEKASRELATVPELAPPRPTGGLPPPPAFEESRRPGVPKLDSPDAVDRRRAALAMGEKGDPEVIPALVAALDSEPEGWVRSELAWALGVLGAAEGVEEVLIPLLEDPVSRARANAVEALHRIGAESFREAALPLLEDRDRRVRANTALALAKTHWRPASRCLEKLSTSPDRLDRHAALFTLQSILPEHRKPLLEGMLDDPDPDVRDRVQDMLRGH